MSGEKSNDFMAGTLGAVAVRAFHARCVRHPRREGERARGRVWAVFVCIASTAQMYIYTDIYAFTSCVSGLIRALFVCRFNSSDIYEVYIIYIYICFHFFLPTVFRADANAPHGGSGRMTD